MGDDIARLRAEMDGVNRELARVLQTRARKAAEIADAKHAAGLPMVDLVRETRMLDAVLRDAPEGFDRDTLADLLAMVFAASRALTQLRHPDPSSADEVTVHRLRADTQRIEAALRESEERFRVAFARAPYGIVVAAMDGTIQTANAAYCAMRGLPVEQVVGRPLPSLSDPAQLHELEASGELRMEVAYEHANGRVVWGRAQVAPLRDAEHRPREMIAIVTDITAEKVAEAEQQRLQGELRQAQQLETVGRLAGGVAHEYNNMLGVILNYAAFAGRRAPGDPRLRTDLQRLSEAANRCAALTRQLLIYSRRDVGAPRPLDLGQVAADAAPLLVSGMASAVDLALDRDPEPWRVELDPGHADQIVSALIRNALEAMPEGGHLVVRSRNVHGATPGVTLTVEDDGRGMSQDVQALAFDPFFTTKDVGRGPGLGLSVVQGIVDGAGGQITLTSAPGRGTRVDVWLPRYQPVDPKHTDVRPRVLLVDDEQALAEVLSVALGEAGYDVVTATRSEQAFALAQPRVDVLVTDVGMAGV